MSVEASKETLEFQTEARQILHLMTHSLYSNKEIFLRELISNASDACDKLRYEALGDDSLYDGDTELSIKVEYDESANTITISDNGLGMSRQEVIDNIGTIASSGTRKFLDAMTGDQAKDTQMIGQFGVGFYASFIVADKVTLETRRAGASAEHAIHWESDGEGSFSLENIEKAIEKGPRDPSLFSEPAFDTLRESPEFQALDSRQESILAEQRITALQMICFNNPIPDAWQPLPETCLGVERQ